ncbi:sialate O-acetylesterase-like [Paramacrobiotus metropolitanus]|uniref:sialate O-acetylesterase-like n=1 Tax=Paramacrobiotus metropolitanus TaxID=2943436 RepID=UPI002445BF7A|nr:sialate O-acetylesterase-like [Paramacrobiotus metropolitanus]
MHNLPFASLLGVMCFAVINGVLLPNHDASKADRISDFEPTEHTFRLANYYQDGMVLQCGEPPAWIWGYGQPGEGVDIVMDVDIISTRVNEHGIWAADLWLMPCYNETFDLEISQYIRKTKKVTTIYLRNMFNGTNELEASTRLDLFKVMRILPSESPHPLKEPTIMLNWTRANPQVLREFSAVCWATVRRIYEDLRNRFNDSVPMGLVGAYYDGTPIRAWSPPQVFSKCRSTTSTTNSSENQFKGPEKDSVLWNAMLAPLKFMTFKAILWYQGESDAALHPDAYACMFENFISTWRESLTYWSKTTPFGFVQIGCQNNESIPDGTALVRWHQTADYGYVPQKKLLRTFMAVAMDLPDPHSPYGSIHPRYKEEIAQRLYTGIMSVVYYVHKPFQGPFPRRIQLVDRHVFIQYDQSINFIWNSTDTFEVCCEVDITGSDSWKRCRGWHAVTSEFTTGGDEVKLKTGPCRDRARFVRYAWKLTPCAYKNCRVYATDDLGDERGLPGPPFVLPTNWISEQ